MTKRSDPDWKSARHRTAIGRSDLSLPSRIAILDSLIDCGGTVLDYGSGRGQDVARLKQMGFVAAGWDPHYNPDAAPPDADIVMLTYVLNVIEDPVERLEVLRSAWGHARRTLVVSTRLTWDRNKVRGESLADGVLTPRNTFQHLFTPSELRELVQTTTGVRCATPVPGVVYAFRHDSDRLAYIARRTLPDHGWSASTDHATALAAVVGFTESQGRFPLYEEYPAEVLPLLGALSTKELQRVVSRSLDPVAFQLGARRTTLDTLLYLAVDRFSGRGRFSEMPLGVQADIRKHFTSYKEACARADRLLLKLRDDQYLRAAMRNSVGKMTPTALYVHRRALDRMPVVLRLYEHCGSLAAGRPPEWTLAKLHHDKKMISWLDYPQFDRDPHPRLASSYAVDLSSLDASFRTYETGSNRPLLHRKHEFLAADDPDVPKSRRLTESEVKAGLYAYPNLIGSEDGWHAELQRCGVRLRGHRLVRA